MKKNVFGRQLKRDKNERKALFKNLLTSLVINESIKTTEAKAKAIKGAADKLITKAKKGGVVAYRGLGAEVNRNAVVKLVEDLGPRFVSRNGGYTRIVKIGNRVADNAAMVLMEWTEKSQKSKVESQKVKKETEKKSSSAKASEDKGSKKVEAKKTSAVAKAKADKPVKQAEVKQVRSAAGRKTG